VYGCGATHELSKSSVPIQKLEIKMEKGKDLA
jgi:hypothetical protein